jgi:hypothetical protein
MVNKIIGTFGTMRFKTEAAAAPFIRGIAKSRIIRSDFSSLAFRLRLRRPRLPRKLRGLLGSPEISE